MAIIYTCVRVCDLAFRDMCQRARTCALLLIASFLVLLLFIYFFWTAHLQCLDWHNIPRAGRVWNRVSISFFVLKVIFSVQVDGESSCSTLLKRNWKKSALIRFIVTFFRAPSHCRNRTRCGHWSSWRPGDWEEPDVANNQQNSTSEIIRWRDYSV